MWGRVAHVEMYAYSYRGVISGPPLVVWMGDSKTEVKIWVTLVLLSFKVISPRITTVILVRAGLERGKEM